MLTNKEESGTQVQLRGDQGRLTAASPDPFTWQGFPYSMGKCQTIYLIHLVCPLVTLQSHGIMGSLDGFPSMKDYQDTLVAFLFSLVEDPL